MSLDFPASICYNESSESPAARGEIGKVSKAEKEGFYLKERILREYLQGQSCEAYLALGAHFAHEYGQEGVRFTVYAPNAEAVYLIGDFSEWNAWDMKRTPQGFWTIFVEGAQAGQLYKYRVKTEEGLFDRADPFGFYTELRPATASVVYDIDHFRWTDGAWMAARDKNYNRPLSIYEVHAGSWHIHPDKKDAKRFLSYDELTDTLLPYVRENGYTHVELLPLTEHPLDASWGYQVSGFFAPTSRYGEPLGLMRFVNACHKQGIGVILDFVPAHFVNNYSSLAKFDGSYLYESDDPALRDSEWGTTFFDFTKPHVVSFLKSALDFWLTYYHFDGIRYDAVSRLIYTCGDESRGLNEAGIWMLRSANYQLEQRHPGAMRIAEDSTIYQKVTAPVVYGGLGFDYKWDMGWMNEVLDYMKKRPDERGQFAQEILHPMEYFYSDIFLLPLSHDEVVHGKGTLWGKIYGTPGEKMRQLRAFWLYFFTTPGKKLSFMGNELASRREWDEKAALEWGLLSETAHEGFYRLNGALSALYGAHPALYKNDYNAESFSWMDTSRAGQAVFAYCRDSLDAEAPERLYTALNFSNRPVPGYEMPVRRLGMYEVLLHTEEPSFGGAGGFTQPVPAHLVRGKPCIRFDLPAMSGVLFREKSAQI